MNTDIEFKEFLVSILNGDNGYLIKELSMRWDEFKASKQKPKEPEWEITSEYNRNGSVKRLIDNEIFTIGDEIEYPFKTNVFPHVGRTIIRSWKLMDGKMYAASDTNHHELKDLQKVKLIPVQLTEDEIQKLKELLK